MVLHKEMRTASYRVLLLGCVTILGCDVSRTNDFGVTRTDSNEIKMLAGVWRWRNTNEPRGYYVIDETGTVKGYFGETKLPHTGRLSLRGNVLRMDSVGERVWFDFEIKSNDLFIETSWFNGKIRIPLPNGDGWERLEQNAIPLHMRAP
jgi:hypothetical protein